MSHDHSIILTLEICLDFTLQIFLSSYLLQAAISDYQLIILLEIKVCIFPKALINSFCVSTISVGLCPDERQQDPFVRFIKQHAKIAATITS